MSYQFGAGTLIGARTDITNPTPSEFATLQDIQVDFAFTTKELMGAYQAPVAIGRGALKITGKAKFAAIKASIYNNLFFGQSSATGLLSEAVNEAGSIPATSTYTVTAANSATFQTDLGVKYALTGLSFTRVASAPAQGQYTVAAGVYTFAAADASTAVLLCYTYTSASGGTKITLNNQFMGSAPQFQANLANTYSLNGAAKVINLQLNACISDKLSLPFKNADWVVNELDFMAMADASNTIGYLSLTDA